MKFLNRLSKYLMGVLIGLSLTYIMFSERGCMDWLPSERIKEDIRSRGIMNTEEVACYLECNGMSVSDLADLVTGGSINYSESTPREIPRKYLIEQDSNLQSAIFVLNDTAATVVSVNFNEINDCDC